MKKNIAAVLTVMMGLCCCMNASLEQNKPAKTEHLNNDKIPVELCYVMCDFSASQDAISLEKIRQNAMEIYNAAKLKCKIKCFDINAPQLEGPFFKFSTLLKNAKKPSDEVKFRKEADSMSKILSAHLVKRSAPIPSQSTCIIKALNTAVQLLISEAKSKDQQVAIIVLSDMLEDCIYDYGRVDIDNANFDNAMKMLDKMPNPLFTLKDYKNVIITLTASSKNDNISSDKLYLFWRKVLAKYHYQLNVPITTNLPSWVNTKNN